MSDLHFLAEAFRQHPTEALTCLGLACLIGAVCAPFSGLFGGSADAQADDGDGGGD
jgi:hypothetical protein